MIPQFALNRNTNAATRTQYPLLLDVQSDLLDPLATRVVVPLTPSGTGQARSMRTLTPKITFGGNDYLMLTPQLAAIPTRSLGPAVGDLAADRATIMAAVDFLRTGI